MQGGPGQPVQSRHLHRPQALPAPALRELVRLVLHLDIQRLPGAVQHLGRLGVLGGPQVDAADLQDLVPHHQTGPLGQAARRHPADEDPGRRLGDLKKTSCKRIK